MQLNYHCYINSTGYSIAAQEYILAMQHVRPDIDIKLHYLNLSTRSGISDNRYQMFESMRKKPTKEPFINLYHSIPQRYRRPRGPTRHVAFCLFETVNPPKIWIEKMNEMDLIITASEFNKNMFRTNGVIKPIEVIPHCFSPKMFNKDIKPVGRYALKTFISMGTWKLRKNWETLIKAFYDAFEAKDNTCLIIKTDKLKELESMIIKIKRTGDWRAKNTAPIYAEEKVNCNFENIPQIMKKGDIYVSASLGEGFGLVGLHAMALGMPVITPRFGGSLQYAKPELCTYIEPLKYKTIAVMDGIPQFSNCIWPTITISEVRDKMREVWSKNPKEKTEKAYNFVHKNFNYDVIGKKMIEVLEL
jgi:glycosyltransferase involved in cell wall biosynthesis